jgi:hypothetical protein
MCWIVPVYGRTPAEELSICQELLMDLQSALEAKSFEILVIHGQITTCMGSPTLRENDVSIIRYGQTNIIAVLSSWVFNM